MKLDAAKAALICGLALGLIGLRAARLARPRPSTIT